MVPMKKCRVCGKEYEACRNTKVQPGVYRWREVACSPECGDIYLQRVLESRGISPKKEKKVRAAKREPIVENLEPEKTEVEVVANSEEAE